MDTIKVIYYEGYRNSYKPHNIVVALEKYYSDDMTTGYFSGYVLSWSVTKSKGDSGHNGNVYNLAESGHELIVGDLSLLDAQVIRQAIKKYDELREKYPKLESE